MTISFHLSGFPMHYSKPVERNKIRSKKCMVIGINIPIKLSTHIYG